MEMAKNACIKSWIQKTEGDSWGNDDESKERLYNDIRRKIEMVVIPTLEKTDTMRQYWVTIDIYETLFIDLMSSVKYTHVDYTFYKVNNSLSIQYEVKEIAEIEKLMVKSILAVPVKNDENLLVQIQCTEEIPSYVVYNTHHQTLTIKYGIVLLKKIEQWIPASMGSFLSVRSECDKNRKRRKNLNTKKEESSRKRRKLNKEKVEAFWKIGIGKLSTMYELDELPEKRIRKKKQEDPNP